MSEGSVYLATGSHGWLLVIDIEVAKMSSVIAHSLKDPGSEGKGRDRTPIVLLRNPAPCHLILRLVFHWCNEYVHDYDFTAWDTCPLTKFDLVFLSRMIVENIFDEFCQVARYLMIQGLVATCAKFEEFRAKRFEKICTLFGKAQNLPATASTN